MWICVSEIKFFIRQNKKLGGKLSGETAKFSFPLTRNPANSHLETKFPSATD